MSPLLAIALSLVLLGLNAFFVGAEFALISARRSVIEPHAEEGSRRARITLAAMEHVSLMMACAQLGITVCSLGLGYLGEPAIAHLLEGPFEAIGIPESLLHPLSLIIALSIVGYLHVVIGEMVPKNIALARPDRAAMALGPILSLISKAINPIVIALNWIANLMLRLVGVDPRDEVTSAFTRDEVAGLVEESRREGLIDPSERRLLVGALTFEERDVRSVLLPMDRLETVPGDVTPAEVEEMASRTGFSRFPVREDGDLRGYLHLKDALEFKDAHRNRPIAPAWIRPLAALKETDRLRAALATMQRAEAHMARVTDANGKLLGIVALEDVLEELVGEIRDETSAGAAARQR
jgi:CBS domain containing-hemolysin-like protein